MAIFSHYFHSAKIQVIGIRLEIKVTETKHSQTPIDSANIYFVIKTTGSLHILCLWSEDFAPGTRSASPCEYDLWYCPK